MYYVLSTMYYKYCILYIIHYILYYTHTWHSGFLYHYLIGGGDLGDLACAQLAVFDVRRAAGANAGYLGGGG
jgi:hypothetical protein